MKREALGRNFMLCILIATMIVGMSSCIKDNQDDCGLSVRFRYTYNIKDADAFSAEVKSVDLWVFGQDGRLVEMRQESGDQIKSDPTITLTDLKSGKYKLVCFARDQQEPDTKNFVLPDLTVGSSTINDLYVRLNRNADNTSNSELMGLYNGTLDVDYSGNPQTVTLSLMKLTKKFRVIIMPYTAADSLSANDFSVMITGSAGWLDYNGEKYQADSVQYTPYSMKTVSDSAINNTKPTYGVVADLSTSRLFYDANPRLIIRNKKSNKDILNINLAWFLSLQGIGEHRTEWSNQEYLDRQDYYSLSFFVQGDSFLETKVIVNGWTVSLKDIDL
ncbi:MAG: FimB/Mfa2 family fimbrial subunit [Prevotella sp.]|jgi:hypothetical protein|nr:FimB/Mfa2 family fimbrial subunit [Prevotella sp.]MCH3995328.1 FimB/Mfa2 family fimbrial subunit [Prevotella sp.]